MTIASGESTALEKSAHARKDRLGVAAVSEGVGVAAVVREKRRGILIAEVVQEIVGRKTRRAKAPGEALVRRHAGIFSPGDRRG